MSAFQHVGVAAPGPAASERPLSSPQKYEAPGLAGAEGFRDHGTDDSHDCADTGQQHKLVATLTARAALLGLVLTPLADGAWRITAGARSTRYPSLQAVAGVVGGCEHVRNEMAVLLQGQTRGGVA